MISMASHHLVLFLFEKLKIFVNVFCILLLKMLM